MKAMKRFKSDLDAQWTARLHGMARMVDIN